MTIHKTVLIAEAVEGLKLRNGSVVVDATLGGGGHSLEILQRIMPKGRLIAIDRDREAIARFEKRIASSRIKYKEESLTLVNDNFARLGEVLFALRIPMVDAIVADLGISSDQLEDPERGFSFQDDGELDMRMDQSKGITAREVVNSYSAEDLLRMIEKYGEEEYAWRIAQGIVKAREKRPLWRTSQLVEVIKESIPKRYGQRRIHFATKTFQALRMEVNEELGSLGKFLNDAIGMLKVGGRLAVISFHSGEDSLVKNIFRENARGCICPPNFPLCRCGKKALVKVLTKKPIVPTDQEIRNNPRSRSAKLRIAERV